MLKTDVTAFGMIVPTDVFPDADVVILMSKEQSERSLSSPIVIPRKVVNIYTKESALPDKNITVVYRCLGQDVFVKFYVNHLNVFSQGETTYASYCTH